jgi:hypothetical protein
MWKGGSAGAKKKKNQVRGSAVAKGGWDHYRKFDDLKKRTIFENGRRQIL